jgi:hypothetical protein
MTRIVRGVMLENDVGFGFTLISTAEIAGFAEFLEVKPLHSFATSACSAVIKFTLTLSQENCLRFS